MRLFILEITWGWRGAIFFFFFIYMLYSLLSSIWVRLVYLLFPQKVSSKHNYWVHTIKIVERKVKMRNIFQNKETGDGGQIYKEASGMKTEEPAEQEEGQKCKHTHWKQIDYSSSTQTWRSGTTHSQLFNTHELYLTFPSNHHECTVLVEKEKGICLWTDLWDLT